ncbi:RsfA family transcriptional regulator [Alkalicoccobacillus murimartini]|uniref:Prespore-specific regulator n=1 Tax=Alkalicoccobacillus murimartini TaxID=171685 RepID=A0ABT9YFR5_9BACI|nr:RsfA family transcriptional regulator [Alkalicoccobacillus murimartini]MDQ0206458.1 prespore-specific regulator [Alkalicoccobacillus murimartini]
MVATRQDAWSDDEDLLLAEVVLRHIRESSTQLAAFEEVGRKLSRSSAACGFRWNSTIRKKYESAVSLAKKQKSKKITQQTEGLEVVPQAPLNQSRKKAASSEKPVTQVADTAKTQYQKQELTLEDVITFLTDYQSQHQSRELSELEEVKQENQQLKLKVDQLSRDKEIITQDYKALLTIMDRARKFTRDHPIERTI